MPSTSELSPIATQHASSNVSPTGEPVKVGIQPVEIIRRHWKLAVTVAVCVGLLGAVALKAYLVPIYEATSIVYVSPNFPTALGDDHDHDRQYDEFLFQQITAATRFETLQRALRSMPDAWPALFPQETEQGRVERLQSALRVERVGASYEVSLTLVSLRPKMLAQFLNQITADYLEDARGEEVYGREEKLTTLKQEKEVLQKQLDADMQKQAQMLQYVGMAKYEPSGSNPIDDKLAKLREQLSDAHEKSIEADAELRGIGGGNPQSGALQQAATELANTDPGVSVLKQSLTGKKALLLAQLNGLKPTSQFYIDTQAQITEIDQRLDQIMKAATRKAATQIQQKALSSKTRAASLENQLTADVNALTAKASTTAPKLQEAQLLTAEIERLITNQATIDNRIQGLSLEGEASGSVRLFSSALPPGGPLKRKTRIAYAVLLFFCLISGAAAALIADGLDPHIYTSRDIRRLVGFPPIGLLLDPKEFSPALQREYFLRLAGGLDQAHRRTGARTFVFPSIGPTSSRSIVEQLGIELAGNGLRVLVVNIQSPSGPEKEGASINAVVPPPNPRLLSMTDGQTTLSTEVDKESYRIVSLPAGEVADLLRRSRSYYNAILVAADPLFTSAYTEHFARTADGTVLIVDSGETRKDELVRAARLLERLKIAGIAIVLNGVGEKRAEEDLARALADYKRAAA
jgi:succinoglycan biosynthesis transport protein ExoP